MTMIDQQQLLESVRDFAERALNAYLEDDTRVILTNAAFSLEHLCKAYLYGVHPALLVELRNGQLDSLLHLIGHGDRARKPLRTISGRDALKRVEDLLPNLNVPRESLAQLIDVRDGMVHVGFMSSSGIDELLTAFLQFSDVLHDELGSEREGRWGEHTELVEALLTRARNQIEQEAHRRIAVARARFARLAEIPVSDLVSAVAARAAEADASSDIRKAVYCLACGYAAPRLSGRTWMERTAADTDEPEWVPVSPLHPESWTSRSDSPVWWIGEHFECPECELTLDSEHLEPAGLPRKVGLGGGSSGSDDANAPVIRDDRISESG
ncbi:hypothetical protein [Actinoallomurus liliacearum]|uniref:hypothetical protein n=1 Tax=Actinoallomurus liliacearum TaxID=1080073 RepID=UPI0031EEE2BC